MFKIAVDAGHGLNTSGKQSPDGEKEWSFNDKVVDAFINESRYYGVEILRVDDPTGQRDVPLQERTDKSNSWGANCYISMHHNANTGEYGDWTGTETYTYLGNVPGSEKLAKEIHARILEVYKLQDRGLKKKDLHVLRETQCDAVLIEGGFMDSTIDINVLRNDVALSDAGKEIMLGIAANYGLERNDSADVSDQPDAPPPAQETSKEIAPKPTLKKGSKGDEVKKLQNYIHAKSDGDFGSNTDTALRNWQKIYGLTIDGIYGSKSQAMMQDVIDGEAKRVYVPTVPTPTLEVGSSGQEVKELQVIINAKVDGDFGPKTEQTLMNWQKVYDLESDGVYGQLTEAKMHEVY